MKTSPLLAALQQLQVGQHNHDVAAHQDILYSLAPKKLTHFTLHFAKYQGAISLAMKSGNTDSLHRALIDSMIIALAAANAMNLDLSGRVREKLKEVSADQSEIEVDKLRHDLLLDYVEIVARKAKACEVIDHLEDYPSRPVLERSVVELVILLDRFAQCEQLDLLAAISERWARVEQRAFSGRNDIDQAPSLPLSLVSAK